MISLSSKISRENNKPLKVLCCNDCAKQLPAQSSMNLCNVCYINKFGQFCHNCEEKKTASDFHNSKSVMCEDCFDRKPKWTMKAMRASVSDVFYASQRNKARSDHENTLRKLDLEMDSQQNRIDIAYRKLQDIQHTLRLVHIRYHDLGVELSEEDAEDLELEEPTRRVLPHELDAITFEYKLEVQHLKNRINHACDFYSGCILDMNKLEDEKEHTIAEHSRTLLKYQVSNDLVMNLVNFIFEGNLSKMEILTKLFQQEGISTKPDTICPAYVFFTLLYNKYGMVSEALKDLESEIREGENRDISDLIPTKNPLKSWFNKCVILNKKSKVLSTNVYESYKKFVKNLKQKAISDRVFTKQFLDLFDENDEITKTKLHGKMFYKGISLDEQEDSESESEENSDDE